MTESLETQNETTTAVMSPVLPDAAETSLPEKSNAPAEPPHKNRLQKVGKVVSDKMDKTIVVEVEYLKKHALYKKSMRRTSRFKAHDEENTCKTGDLVRIEESRPYSKEKTWRLVEIIKKGVRL